VRDRALTASRAALGPRAEEDRAAFARRLGIDGGLEWLGGRADAATKLG
jgi:hypothetical protein